MNQHTRSVSNTSTITILGGGIAGLTAAIALKQIGINAKVFEAAPQFKPIGAGIALGYNAIKAFQHLNIDKAIVQAGHSFQQFNFYNEKGKVINKNAQSLNHDGAVNTCIHRATLHDILLSHLDADQLITGKRSTNININHASIEIEFEDLSHHKTNNLIIAEGINSPLRKKFIPNTRRRYAGYTCWRGITHNAPGIYEPSETWGRKGRFGIVPLAHNKIYWFACKNASESDDSIKHYSINDLYNNFQYYHHPIGEIIRSTTEENIILNDIYDLKPNNQYAFDNVVFIGDAAHATTPNMGQGACQAIEDGVILAHCLKEYTNVEKAFHAFEKKRLKKTHYIVNQSWQIGKVAQLENKSLIAARNFIMRNMPSRLYEKQLQRVYAFDL